MVRNTSRDQKRRSRVTSALCTGVESSGEMSRRMLISRLLQKRSNESDDLWRSKALSTHNDNTGGH